MQLTEFTNVSRNWDGGLGPDSVKPSIAFMSDDVPFSVVFTLLESSAPKRRPLIHTGVHYERCPGSH